MMDRTYPTSSFADSLAPPAQTVASWAYDRSTASIKPSPSYGAAHLDTEVLQRQSYTSTHQLPTYTTSHPSAAAGTLDSNSNSSETSIMSFLSAMESRSLQAGPVSASLLSPFRPPSWPAGTNSSTTELYLTGALPSAATFPSPASLSTYQHTGAYPPRSYATNPSLALQDPAFSTSTNGLFSHHDPLLHLKSSQTVLPTALAFNHLSAPVLGSTLPVQSSTYRSAQESAPHLLQPQFSLLPSTLPVPHGAPYAATVFSGSIERALQRECSVIKHHQRPSSSHTASEQMPNSEHSLPGYFGSGSEADVSYQQDPSHQTAVSCSPSTGIDSSQGVNGAPQPKTDSVTQTYSTTSVPKAKDCPAKLPPHQSGGEESGSHTQILTGASPERYSSPQQNHNSVISNQHSLHLPSLMSSSLSQTYVTPHTQSSPSSSTTDKLSSLYKSLPSLSSQSATVSQTLVYSTNSGLSQEQEVQYRAQVQGLCQGNLSNSYPTSHSQGPPNVTFTSQSQGQASVTQSQSYATGQSLNQSLNSAYPPTCVRSLPASNSAQNYNLMQTPVGGKTHDALQQTQAQKYVFPAPQPTYSSAAQALRNNARSSIQDIKPTYSKHKLEELPMQDLEALQQASMEASAADNNLASHNVIYVVSKMEEHHKTQSVIRSNSRSDDHLMGLAHTQTEQVKDERMGLLSQQHIHLSGANGLDIASIKPANSNIISSHVPLSSEQLKQHHLQLKSPEPHQQNHQNHSQSQSQTSVPHTQFITVPSTQVLLEPNQMILLQQPIIHHGQNPSKVVSVQSSQPPHGLGPANVQYLQMDRELLGPTVTENHSQHGAVVSEQSSGCTDSSKHHYSHSANQQSNDAKNHFALNSICFPESMLLGDERNILSNVDDILAATVAACGVTPQDFVKATSSAEAEMAVMASPVDSKGHFQTVDISNISPNFSSPQQIITNTNSHTLVMTLNGPQVATDHQGQSVHHSSSSEINTNGDGGRSENDYHLAGQVYDPSGLQSRGKVNAKCIKTEESLMECPDGEDFPKKKARSKSLTKPGGIEEDGGQARAAKRGTQVKRLNSRGSDVGSPSASHGVYDGCPQQERMRQKIREVEEKQPEVKTGFMGSFLDFIKSGPKQQYSPSPTRTINRPKKLISPSRPPPCPLPSLPPKLQTLPGPLISQECPGASSQHKRLDEDLQKNLETLPTFSSDEEENTGKNQALRNSISSALSALDEASERKTRTDNPIPGLMMKQDQVANVPHAVKETCFPQVINNPQTTATATVTVTGGSVFASKDNSKEIALGQMAMQLMSVAIEGLTDEELSDSGGEGMYRERDEFVVRNEDIENLKVTMRTGIEPPAIWKVQKALLQKFVPEIRDGKRVFSATNSYLGYFGDAKTMYHRVYVKFLDTVNKREYVRVCSRKPRCKPMNSLRGVQVKTLLGLTANPSSVAPSQKPRPKHLKTRAEPPPKKRRKWKEEFSPTASGSSAEEGGEESDLNPSGPSASRFLNTRTTKETFKSFVELLISVALDEDVMTALERANDELLLPHMKRVDGMITDNRKRLLQKLHIGQVLKTALDSFPEISVVTELKKDGETPAFKVRLSGKAYNKKTMKPYKMNNKVPQEYTVDQQKTQWFSLYHSLQHYKYHTYLMCKDEIASLRVQAGDLGQEETVQKCLQNGAWVEGLFDRFGELINQVQQACQ